MTEARITGVGLIPLTLPLRRPFVTALGEKRESRNLLVAIRLSNGIVGYGEASSSLAWPQETPSAMSKGLRRITPSLIGAKIGSYRRLIAQGWEIAGEHPTGMAALECALLDAFTRAQGISLWRWFGGKRRSVTTALTISAWEPATAARVAGRAFALGFRTFKVKVTGRNIDEDIRRVTAVHKAAPRAILWVDANQGFLSAEAVRFALFLRQQKLPVRLLEQPVHRENREGLAQVQREGGIPVAADESARSAAEACSLIRRRLADVINVKLAKSGLFGALQIIRLAKRSDVQLMIGCMAESVIGLSPNVALAAGLGAFDFVDLDSHLLVVSPPCRPGFTSRGARLSVSTNRPGTGVRFPLGRSSRC